MVRFIAAPPPRQFCHGRQQALDLTFTAARKQCNQGFRGIETGTRKKGFTRHFWFDHFHQRVAHPDGLNGKTLEKRGFEIKKAVKRVEDTAQLRDAALLPGPNLWTDELVQFYGGHGFAKGFGEAQIEPWVIDE